MVKQIFKADETESDIRIDTYLSGIFSEFSRTKIQELIKSKRVFVNSKPCKPSYNVRTDDEIVCDFDSEINIKIEPENHPIEILYEDEPS